jgi:hypothetical protein
VATPEDFPWSSATCGVSPSGLPPGFCPA